MNYPQQPWGQQNYQQPNQYPQNQGQAGWGWGPAAAPQAIETGAERLAFLRKVYALFAASVVVSGIGALIALNFGATSAAVMYHGVPIPPLVHFFGTSPIISIIVMFGVVFGASALRRVQVVNVLALFGMALILGLVFAPNLFIAQLAASTGSTVSANPVRDAFILASLMFGGLTGYVVISKRDFSYIGGFLSMGFFVIFGAALLNIFLGSQVLSLAIASVGLILFGGYVLYDTSRILKSEDRDAVGGALTLYLDFLNIFLFILRLLGSRR
ncbi:MAG: Bax inhibitor-1/YccA family protein [Polyangiaceae bacterium]|nr:Bax inhibitor-1/YccA family protein [Polyangiaceae bacterium]